MSASVDDVTAQMATTSLDNNTTDNAGAQPTAAENEAVLASAAEGRRLYIGNLAYATTEGELKEFFKDYLIESVTIPTNPRTSRPVGYAFVALSTPTEAERAIAELNGKAILERKVSIQLARTPETHAEGSGSGAEGNSTEHRRRGSTRGRGRGRGRGARTGRGGRAANGTEGAEGAEQTEGEAPAPAESAPTNVPGQVIPLTESTNESLTPTKGSDAASKKPAPVRKQRGPPEDGVPSKIKVMVANLPYDLKEDKLLELFQDYSPSTAKIALRPIPRFMVKKLQARGEARKGRGFGFVTLGSEELQQKACEEMNGKEVEGREIAVKVAIDSPGKEDDHEAHEGEEAPSADATEGTTAATEPETKTPAAVEAAA